MKNKQKNQQIVHRVSSGSNEKVKYSLSIIGEENEVIELTQTDFDMIVTCGEDYHKEKNSDKMNKKNKKEKKKNKTVPFATLTIIKGKNYYYKSEKLTPKKAEKKFEKGLTALIDNALKNEKSTIN